MSREGDVDATLSEIRAEVLHAMDKFGSMASSHEGWAVIYEEVEELWEEVKANRGYRDSAFTEAKQIAAMAVRYMVDLDHRRDVNPRMEGRLR